MNAETEAIFNAPPSLPPDNRATLAEKLLDSLSEKEQMEIDTAWAKEAGGSAEGF